MSHRFFVETPIAGESATLVDAEAHHLIHVMRAGPGDEVTLFDGSGAEFPARVTKLSRSQVELAVLSRLEISRELPFELTLGVPLPRGDRQKWLVEKATELGVTRLVPLVTARSVIEPGSGALDKLRRTVIESAKQCGRNLLMKIEAPQSWPEFLAAAPVTARRVIAHPEFIAGSTAKLAPTTQSIYSIQSNHLPIILAVGPEGGFTTEEIAAAGGSGWRLERLGPRILRIETAALTLVVRMIREE